jgi:hypothetical protein
MALQACGTFTILPAMTNDGHERAAREGKCDRDGSPPCFPTRWSDWPRIPPRSTLRPPSILADLGGNGKSVTHRPTVIEKDNFPLYPRICMPLTHLTAYSADKRSRHVQKMHAPRSRPAVFPCGQLNASCRILGAVRWHRHSKQTLRKLQSCRSRTRSCYIRTALEVPNPLIYAYDDNSIDPKGPGLLIIASVKDCLCPSALENDE